MKKLTITALLRTPVAASGYMTMDAILASLLFTKLNDVDAAHAAIPIKCTDGLYHASAMQTAGAEVVPFSITASLRADKDLDIPKIIARKNGRQHRKFHGSKRSSGGNIQSFGQVHESDVVMWDVVGDEDHIRDLLMPVGAIGQHRARGWGEVTEWLIEDGAMDGLTDGNGNPTRPIPIEMFEGNTDRPIVDAGWRPAYWNPLHRTGCYAP